MFCICRSVVVAGHLLGAKLHWEAYTPCMQTLPSWPGWKLCCCWIQVMFKSLYVSYCPLVSYLTDGSWVGNNVNVRGNGGRWPMLWIFLYHQFDGLVQEGRDSSALAMELGLSCTNQLIYQTSPLAHWDVECMNVLLSVNIASGDGLMQCQPRSRCHVPYGITRRWVYISHLKSYEYDISQ